MTKAKHSEIDWPKVEQRIRQELRDAVADGRNDRLARMALHRIDLILGDATGRGYEIEGVAPAEWCDDDPTS